VETPSKRSTTGSDLDEVADLVVTSARALVGLALRSLSAAPVEITLPQHRLLVLLAARGDQSIGSLAESLGVNASNASRLCDRLQRQGLVARRPSPADGRAVNVVLTPSGRDLLGAVHTERRRAVADILAQLDPDGARTIAAGFQRFNEAANEASVDDWVGGAS
jgi:DNA-binding MarR family transcriptional regulator